MRSKRKVAKVEPIAIYWRALVKIVMRSQRNVAKFEPMAIHWRELLVFRLHFSHGFKWNLVV